MCCEIRGQPGRIRPGPLDLVARLRQGVSTRLKSDLEVLSLISCEEDKAAMVVIGGPDPDC